MSDLGTEGWPKVGEELKSQTFGPFGPDALARYALVSGDDNPLHLDPEIAKLAGLDAPPLHGMLMMSHFEPALMTWIASWRRDVKIAKLSGKFLRPVLAGQAITISGKIVRSSLEPQPHLILRLMAHGAGRDLAILAEATLLPRGA